MFGDVEEYLSRFYSDIDRILPYLRRAQLPIPKNVVEDALHESGVSVVPWTYEKVKRDAGKFLRSKLGSEPKTLTEPLDGIFQCVRVLEPGVRPIG